MLRTTPVALLLLSLAGCPTVDLGQPPVPPGACQPDPVRFEMEVWPNAIATADTSRSCIAQAGCHSRETGRSALRLIPNPTTPSEWSTNYDVVTRFLNCSTPDASPLITKPASGGDPHGGGDIPGWMLGDPDSPATLVEQWVKGS